MFDKLEKFEQSRNELVMENVKLKVLYFKKPNYIPDIFRCFELSQQEPMT